MTKKTWIAAAAVALAVAGAGAWWFLRPADEAQKLKLGKVEQGPLQAVVAAAGTVKPVVQVSVGTQVSGQIRELAVDFNSEVKRGQIIARIDPQSFESKVSQATADVDAARATALTAEANVNAALATAGKAQLDAENAKRDLARKQDLFGQNFISIAEVDTARNTAATLAQSLKVTQAQIDVAKAQARNAAATIAQRQAVLNQAKIDLDRTVIRSPVDGVVIKRSVDIGQTVAASLQAPELYIIAENLADMQVEVSIDEADIGRIRPGQAASFTVDAFPGRTYEGKVSQVRKSATIASNVVTYTVVVAFANTTSQLLPGMTANARIVTDKRDNALKVPNAALRVRIAGVAEPGAPAASPAPAAAPAPGSAPGGGGADRMRAFREALAVQAGFTPEQLIKVDEIQTSLRPKYAALRELPEDQRARAGEALRAEMRARVAELATPAQKPKFEQAMAELGGRAGTSSRGRVYVPGDDGKPRALGLRLGISDGSMTEVLGVLGGELAVGDAVLLQAPGAGGASGARPGGATTGGPRPPF
ncbi:efflux RND transporter periplasmic adaptor subunit [Rivibacter subsaxonicus]|uniref:HlyD family secretion protein n=1 Tax=Rivibacter subsaxonicus TaxID=457575 RepID=A0A4Q7VND8_9BURK|nr:efflux RND transporter periplasmic adaptor subunit [Rivibacter subsaxonicus]RZT97697.1 HlyD family secretion protein [Rivibacter subsaxonicus]